MGLKQRGKCVSSKQGQEKLPYEEYVREKEKQREFKTRT